MANPQIQNDPIYSLPHLYIDGLNISVASTTIIAIAPGQARDSSDNIDMPVSFPNLQGNVNPPVLFSGYLQPLLLNSAVNGANGLDQGSLAASTQYAIWLIGDSRGYNQVAGLISLTSNASPLMPAGYDSLRLLGFVATNSDTEFDSATTMEAANFRSFYLQPPVVELSGGNSTSFAAIDLDDAIPVTSNNNIIAYLVVNFTPAAVGDTVMFRPTGSTATSGLVTITGLAAGVPQIQYQAVIAGLDTTLPAVDYKVSSASDSVTVSVAGWTFAPVS